MSFSVLASVIISVNASIPDFVPTSLAPSKVVCAAFNVVTASSTSACVVAVSTTFCAAVIASSKAVITSCVTHCLVGNTSAPSLLTVTAFFASVAAVIAAVNAALSTVSAPAAFTVTVAVAVTVPALAVTVTVPGVAFAGIVNVAFVLSVLLAAIVAPVSPAVTDHTISASAANPVAVNTTV